MIIDLNPVVRDSFGIERQDFGSQTFNRDPGQNKETRVIGNEMQIVFFGLFVPSDEGVAGFNRPGGRSPADARNRPLADKGDVFKMISDNLAITEVMMLLNEAVVEGFKFGVSDQLKFNRR